MNYGTVRRLDTTVICKAEGRYISFPDVVKTLSGKLICAFRDADIHYPPETIQTWMVLMDSEDGGKTWQNSRRFPYQPRDQKEWAWHCPRMSLLRDGRIVLVCDLANSYTGRVSIYVSLSQDQGQTWTEPVDTGCVGILPDRIIELSDEEWIFAYHWSVRIGNSVPITKRLAQHLAATVDGGKTWSKRADIARSDLLNYCEGSTVCMPDGELVCYLRENTMIHYPTYVCRSLDKGHTWSDPLAHPTHAHRPCAGVLDENTVLMTYRNVAGMPGLNAWIGPVTETGVVVGGMDLGGDSLSLASEGMKIITGEGSWQGVEFQLFPMSSWDVEVEFSSRLRRISGEQYSCGMRAGGYLSIEEGRVVLSHEYFEDEKVEIKELGSFELDTSVFHDYLIRYFDRCLEVRVDGKKCISAAVANKPFFRQRKIAFGNLSCKSPNPVRFENQQGESIWQGAALCIKDSKLGDYDWEWDAQSGEYPNQYQRTHSFHIDTEKTGDWAESGYSGWVRLDDNLVYCVDYRRCEAEKPYVVGHLLEIG